MHPLVGAWRITVADSAGQLRESAVVTFHWDGTVIEIDQDGTWWQGVWQATGERTASYRLVSVNSDGTGMAINGAVEVASDGASWVAPPETTLALGEGAHRITVDGRGPASAAGTPELAPTKSPTS